MIQLKTPLIFLLLIGLISCNNDEHQDPTHNFTIQRLIIKNDKNEILMMREDNVWATPSLAYTKRQFLKEGLDSLSNAYGVKTTTPELRGYFSYKYDYHPYATLRSFFVANYISGEPKLPEGMADVRWVPMEEAIQLNSVTSIRQITEQILSFPDVVWGGSFLVSHVGDDHPTSMVEDFYPLFNKRTSLKLEK